jgi:hypothetical protein
MDRKKENTVVFPSKYTNRCTDKENAELITHTKLKPK